MSTLQAQGPFQAPLGSAPLDMPRCCHEDISVESPCCVGYDPTPESPGPIDSALLRSTLMSLHKSVFPSVKWVQLSLPHGAE